MTFEVNGVAHELCSKTGLIRQLSPSGYNYTLEYAARQGTTIEMAYLRLGVLLTALGFDYVAAAKVLEVGPGNGTLLNVLKKHCDEAFGFDVAPTEFSTISRTAATSTPWDLLVACDVIEHFRNVDDLFQYKFEHALITVPCLPDDLSEMANWRHFKPDEHLWYFTKTSFWNWITARGYDVIFCDSPEDTIRTRWNKEKPNTITFVIKRAK